MFIYTHNQSQERAGGQLFDTDTGIRYSLAIRLQVENQFQEAVRLQIESAHASYGENDYGISYRDDEAIAFWTNLYALVGTETKQLMVTLESLAGKSLAQLEELRADAQRPKAQTQPTEDEGDHIPF